VLGYSDDCELLEIVLPADFETVILAKSEASREFHQQPCRTAAMR